MVKIILVLQLFLLFSSTIFNNLSYAAEGTRVNYLGQSYSVFRVALPSDNLELYSKTPDGQRIKNAAELKIIAQQTGRKLRFATNSGIFDRNFLPLGLYVENGVKLVPLNKKSGEGNFYLKPNGVFFISEGKASIVETEKFREKTPIAFATQSGPLLVIANTINPAFSPTSSNKVLRSGVGVKTPSEVYFAISDDDVSFYEFAKLFNEKLGCSSALYLDGAISVMHLPEIQRIETSGSFAAMFAVFEKNP